MCDANINENKTQDKDNSDRVQNVSKRIIWKKKAYS